MRTPTARGRPLNHQVGMYSGLNFGELDFDWDRGTVALRAFGSAGSDPVLERVL